MRIERLRESETKELLLTPTQAVALTEAGRRLASDKTWWAHADQAGKPNADRTVIECRPRADGVWRVRVREAIGLVIVDDLQIEVEPKIPMRHMLYLFEQGGLIPKLDQQRGRAKPDQSLWRLVVLWFLSELERILRRDLLRGYKQRHDDLRLIRGRLRPISTGLAYYVGRMEFPCDYENYSQDMPLNRLLRAAAQIVGHCPTLGQNERLRAKSSLARMGQVGDLRPGDRNAPIDRGTTHYLDAVLLARNILDGYGRLPQSGEEAAWTFLLRTPEPVENGIRQILYQRLRPRWVVTKDTKYVDGNSMSFNPDLVFNGGLATGDVKYTVVLPEWRRQDIYQAIAFATIYKTQHAALIAFRRPGAIAPPDICVGDMDLRHMDWLADPAADPRESATILADQVGRWLESVDALQRVAA